MGLEAIVAIAVVTIGIVIYLYYKSRTGEGFHGCLGQGCGALYNLDKSIHGMENVMRTAYA